MSNALVAPPNTEVETALPFGFDLVRATAAATPELPALLVAGAEDGPISYSELVERVDVLADRLVAAGVGLDRPVAVLLDRSVDGVVAMLAIMLAGGVYCPLDAAAPDARLAAITRAVGVRVAVADPAQSHRLPPGTTLLTPVGPAGPGGFRQAPGQSSLAYAMFTSGSTGRPKCVAMTHIGLSRLLRWQVADGERGLRTLQFTATGFDVTFQEVLSTILTGGCLVIAPERVRRDPALLLDTIVAHRVQRLFLPYAALQLLATSVQRRRLVPDSLEHVVTAGERLVITPAIRSLFDALPHCRLDNHYGPTETHLVTSHTLDGHGSSWQLLPLIGRPVDDVVCRVLDDELREVAVDEVGELYVGGSGLARGYLGAPASTAERFVADARGTGARLYRTGDLVQCTDGGDYAFVGRVDDQLTVRGYRVEPGEVELALTSHPRVDVAAVGLRTLADGIPVLVAYLQTSGPVGHREIAEHVRGLLPPYLVPARFVELATLPRTSSGKVDGGALARLELPAAPSGEPLTDAADLTAAVTAVWARVLGYDDFDADDDFFDVGGDSLLAAWVVAELGQLLDRPVELSVFLEHSTVAEIAAALATAVPVLGERAPSSSSQIITLRPGPSGRSLYLLHPLGGELLGYRELARASRAPLRLLGIGWRGDPPGPDATLAEIAAKHVAQLRTIEPVGPYRLAGWSFGGVLAYEMAQQLLAAGGTVECLALLDANPVLDPITGLPLAQTPFLGLLDDAARLLDDPESTDLAELSSSRTWLQLMGAPVAAGPGAAHLRPALRTARACMSAVMRYRPAPYAGPVHLFQAAGTVGQARLAGAMRELCTGPLTVLAVPGDHWSFLHGQHVEDVARELDDVLERAGRTAGERTWGRGGGPDR